MQINQVFKSFANQVGRAIPASRSFSFYKDPVTFYSQGRGLIPFSSVFHKSHSSLSQKNVYHYQQKYNVFGEEIDEQTDPQTDVKETINHFIEYYARKDVHTPNVLVSAYYKLQGARLGIRVKDINFLQFLKLTEDMIVARQLKPLQVRNIAFKLQQIGVFTSSIWKHILEFADKDFETIDGTTYIEIIYTICDSKSDTHVEQYIQENEEKISKAIMKSSMNVLAFVQGVYLLSRIRDIKPQEKESIRNVILNRQSEIYQSFNANQLADIIFLVYEIFSDEIKTLPISTFIKKTIDTFIIKDLAEYDSMLQQYEFVDRKNDEIGILDNLKWSSAAKVLSVISDDVYYDQNLYRRMEDLIMRKSETDIIDLDSASILLESMSLIEIAEVSIIMRIVEMLDRRFQEEGNKAYEIVHPQSIIRIMTVLNHFLDTDIALEFCDRLQNYFAGLVKSGDIDYKLTSEYLIELKMVFEESPITHLNTELFAHMNKLLKEKTSSEQQLP